MRYSSHRETERRQGGITPIPNIRLTRASRYVNNHAYPLSQLPDPPYKQEEVS